MKRRHNITPVRGEAATRLCADRYGIIGHRPEDLIAALGRLKQRDEVWEGTVRLERTWTTFKHGPPYRRSFVLLTDGQGSVLVNKLFDAPPTTEELWLALGAYLDAVTQF